MAIKREQFKMAIGSPTNQERTFLVGEGVFIGDNRQLLVHTLPIYRQKDYPNYQVRKQGPWVISFTASGLRVSATAEKMVFAKESDAINFGEALMAFFSMFGLPFNSDDPRTVLEKAKELKEQIFEPMKALATTHGATFILPQQ